MKATIFDIQRNSYVDGPGIRTTVFFKGCNLKCKWCHNPESQSGCVQMMFYASKCTGCGKCKEVCPNNLEKCDFCGRCNIFCPNDARKVCGMAANVMSEKMFGKVTDGYDRVKKQQMLLCEWIRLTFEAHRRNMWFTSGLVYWMFNDCWPAANGWSIIDYYAKPKPGYYTFKRCAQPMVASIENKGEKLLVHISNDIYEKCDGTGSLYLYDFKENKKSVEKTFAFSVGENTSEMVFECDYAEFEKLLGKDNIIICDTVSNLGDDRTFYVKDGLASLDLSYADVEIIAEDADSITVKASEFVPYAILDLPYLLEDNAVTMLTGEIRKIAKTK